MTDDRRPYLHTLLCAIPGVTNAYHQPPETVKMTYPCIVYKWDTAYEKRANDGLYNFRKGYLVTIIDKNPDSPIPGIFHRNFPQASFDRTYVDSNLNHWVYNLVF